MHNDSSMIINVFGLLIDIVKVTFLNRQCLVILAAPADANIKRIIVFVLQRDFINSFIL